MDIHGNNQTYNTFGGNDFYSFVADLLSERLGNYGTAIETVELTGYLRSATRRFLPTLEGLFDQYHDYLGRLPKITFRRKLKRVEICFLSEHFTADDAEGWNPSPEKCTVAAGEMAAALPLLRKRITPADDFDVERFLADAANILATKIETLEEWEQIRQQAMAKRKERLATKDPWELLEIDWDRYHPKAREVLDDPFFWETANDLAPNGNDTGADLLEDYRRWDKRNATASPVTFLERLMKKWDIKPIDWSITEKEMVRKLEQEEPIALSVCNEAAIGLAFAVLKMRAMCPPDVVHRGLAALKRTAAAVMDSTLSDDVKGEWDVAIGKMQAKLESLQRSG